MLRAPARVEKPEKPLLHLLTGLSGALCARP